MNNNSSNLKKGSDALNNKTEQGNPSSPTPLQKFEASMKIGFEEWHDGIGYNISAIRIASQVELESIEQILINHRPRDWRDIEALAEIHTKCSREAIKEAIKDPNPVVRVAVTRFAPELITNNEIFHRFLTEGINVTYQKDGHPRGDFVWLVDFENPENNEFTVVNQFTVIENGIPLIILFPNNSVK